MAARLWLEDRAPDLARLQAAAEVARSAHGDDARALLRAAEAKEAEGDAEGATAALLACAALYRGAGRHLEAISVLKHLLHHEAAPVELYGELARAYGRLGLAAECVAAWRSLARSLDDRGRPLDALTGLEEALEHAPRDAALRLDVAQRSLELGRVAEACRELRWALATGGEVATGGALLELAERLLAEDPGLHDVACHVALVHLEEGRPQVALALLERARAAHPDNLTLLGLSSRALRETGEQESADELLDAAVVEDPSARLGDAEVALYGAEDSWVLEPALDEEEGGASAAAAGRLLREARSHLRFGLRDEAARCLAELLEGAPAHLEGRALLCDIFLAAGHYEGAVGELSRLVELAHARGDARLSGWRALLAELAEQDEWTFALERMGSPIVTARAALASWDDDDDEGDQTDSALGDAIRDLVEGAPAQPSLWRPREVPEREEDARPARRLFAFFRLARRRLFEPQLQSRLTAAFEDSGARAEVPVAKLALALLLAEATGASLAEAAELSLDSGRWRAALDHDGPDALALPEELAALRAVLDEEGLFLELLGRARALAKEAALWPGGEPGPEAEAALARLGAASLSRFTSADEGFFAWRRRQAEGYVLRHFGGPRAEGNVVHKASCPHLARRRRRAAVELLCGPSLADVEGEAVRLRGEQGYRRCKACLAAE